MILVVDDLRTFPFEAVYARTSGEALDILASCSELRELWLDHDLGGDDTISPVLTFLEERHFLSRRLPIRRIVVHSANPPGAERIVRALEGIYPVVRVDALAYGATSPAWD